MVNDSFYVSMSVIVMSFLISIPYMIITSNTISIYLRVRRLNPDKGMLCLL